MARWFPVRRGEWWLLAALLLPLVLIATSLATLARLNELREMYLRSRAASVAARLETLPPMAVEEAAELLSEEEPALVGLQVYSMQESGPGQTEWEPIRRGQQLFRVQRARIEGVDVLRFYLPFHRGGELHIARLDLALSAADWLLAPARRNVMAAALSGLVLIALSLYALWTGRRRARLERERLALEHLARLGRMSAALAHEIRNPLGAIKGFVQLAAEKADPTTGALLAPVLDEIRRLERLVSDLLLYGKPPQPQLRWTDWEALAAELRGYAAEAAQGRPLRWVSEGGAVRFLTDPDLLKAALLNLVRNAVEALGETGGEVRLEARPQPGGGLLLAVEDDGPGLPEQIRQHLFEPFSTTKASGAGLGLSIARRLTEALGGELRLLPRAPRGTRAELRFDRVPWETSAAQGASRCQGSW